MPAEVFNLVTDEWEKASAPDRIVLSLVCKRFARVLSVRRREMPRPVNLNANTAPTQKRARLNFLLRLAPWFDGSAARLDPDIQAIEQARAEGRYADVPKLAVVDKGWILCVSCLKFRRARVALLDVNAASSTDPSLPGRWTRCSVTREDEAYIGQRIDLDSIELHWTTMPGDKRKLVGYLSVRGRQKQAGKKVRAAAKGQAKGKARKEKTNAPESADKAVVGPEGAAPKAKDLAELTGLEDCHYLPVDIEGERVAEFSLCPLHLWDPIKLIGL